MKDSNVTQTEKIISLENELAKLIKKVDPKLTKEVKPSSNISERIGSMSSVIRRISQAMDDKEKKSKIMPETSSGDSCTKTAPTSNEESQKTVKPKKKAASRPLELSGLFSDNYTKYYLLKISPHLKRKINPYTIIDQINTKTGQRPKQLTGYNASSFTIEVCSEQQGQKLGTDLTIDGNKLEIISHPTFNKIRGLIYVEDIKIDSIGEFQDYLQSMEKNLTSITEAPFIRTRNPGTQVFILEFNQEQLPHSICRGKDVQQDFMFGSFNQQTSS